MELIETKSFKLAVYMRGERNASKLAMLLPGRLDTKDYAHTTSHVDYLAGKGYFAFSFDPPGTWESPGSIDLYTMTNYMRAVNELVSLFGNKPTILMGNSRGGSMAMLAGPNNKYVTHIIAVMSYAGPSEVDENKITDGVEISYRDVPQNDSENRKRFDLPLNYFKDAAKHNILDNLKKCSKPKLFFYGTKDILVEPEDVKSTYQACIEPKMIHELNSEHDYRRHKEIVDEVNEVVGRFLDEY